MGDIDNILEELAKYPDNGPDPFANLDREQLWAWCHELAERLRESTDGWNEEARLAERSWLAKQRELERVTRERDVARHLHEQAEAALVTTVENETAEAIAAWLDDTHVGRDDDPHDIAAEIRDELRAGAWRAKGQD